MAALFSFQFWLLVAISVVGLEAAYLRCSQVPECVGADCPSEETCPYGTYLDRCRNTACAKGPGETCGVGMFQVFGSCGDGMYCACGRCIGCSTRSVVECFDKTCT